MGQEIVLRNRPVSNGLHPYVYGAIAALALWFVLAIWVSFASDGYTDWLLMVVSAFLMIFVALPFVLSRVSRDDADDGGPRRSFRNWASCEFDTWQYRLKCGHAAVEVLLPVAAIAFGMTAFGVILLLVSHGTI
jgi:energy-coupling factor transporter transmembrane protein EcfT